LPIWNINSLAEKFLEKFSKYGDNFRSSLLSVKKDRKDLIEALKTLPNIKTYPSDANFILCKLLNNRTDSEKLAKLLFVNENIFIKDLSEKMGKQFFRLTVRKKCDNKKLIKALNKYL